MRTTENGFHFALIAGLSILTLFLVLYSITIFRNLRRRHARYQQQTLRDVEMMETERTRIAEDLHDDLGSVISRVVLGLEILKEADPTNELIHRMLEHLDFSRIKLRDISHNLVPKVLVSKGLIAGITDLADEYNGNPKLVVHLAIGMIDYTFEPNRSKIIYRVMQEMLSNVVKHANATKVRISIDCVSSQLQIRFADNGTGFDVEDITDKEKKCGLKNICSRLEILSANYTLETSPGKGTKYTINIPLQLIKQQHGK